MRFLFLFLITAMAMAQPVLMPRELLLSEITVKIEAESRPANKAAAQRHLASAGLATKPDAISCSKIYALAYLVPATTADLRASVDDFKVKYRNSKKLRNVEFMELMALDDQDSANLEAGKRGARYEAMLARFPEKRSEERLILLPNMIQQFSSVGKPARMVELCEAFIEEFPDEAYTPHARYMLALAEDDEEEVLSVLSNWPDKESTEYLSMLGPAASMLRSRALDKSTTTTIIIDGETTRTEERRILTDEQAQAKLAAQREAGNALLDEMIVLSDAYCTWTHPSFQKAWCYMTYWPKNEDAALTECVTFITERPDDETIHMVECHIWAAGILGHRSKAEKVEAEALLAALESETWWKDKAVGMEPAAIQAWITAVRRQVQ